jgi:hypothetical protein
LGRLRVRAMVHRLVAPGLARPPGPPALAEPSWISGHRSTEARTAASTSTGSAVRCDCPGRRRMSLSGGMSANGAGNRLTRLRPSSGGASGRSIGSSSPMSACSVTSRAGVR